MSDQKRPTRITVNVSPDTADALRLLMDREGVTITEAVRRLIGYGAVVYRGIRIDGQDVLLRDGDETRMLILL